MIDLARRLRRQLEVVVLVLEQRPVEEAWQGLISDIRKELSIADSLLPVPEQSEVDRRALDFLSRAE